MQRAVNQPIREAGSGEGHEVNTGLTATAPVNMKSIVASISCFVFVHEFKPLDNTSQKKKI